ncbi:unnamed protein product [Malus baccata var. baccata]
MATSAMKGKAWTRKEDEALCRPYRWVLEDSVRGSSQTSEVLKAASRHESGANYYDKVRQVEELYTDDNSKTFNPPQQRVGPMPFRNASSNVDGYEDGSPTIQETRVENSSPSEGSMPKAMGRNKARKLKEKGKAKDDYTFQQKMAASL